MTEDGIGAAEVRPSLKELEEATPTLRAKQPGPQRLWDRRPRGHMGGRAVLVMKLNPDATRQASERFLREVTSRAPCTRIVELLVKPEGRCIVRDAGGGTSRDRLATAGGAAEPAAEGAAARCGRGGGGPRVPARPGAVPHPAPGREARPTSCWARTWARFQAGRRGAGPSSSPSTTPPCGAPWIIDPLLLRTGKSGPAVRRVPGWASSCCSC